VHKPLSDRAIEDERLLDLIRESYTASGRVYGSPRIFLDIREAGERVRRKRVARIMREHRIRAVRGYKTPRHLSSIPSAVAPNRLQRQFSFDQPDHAWITDITYVRTWEGWLYLAIVMDLHSRMIIGWSM
jgi:putative transposase